MRARKSMIIFLVKGDRLKISRVELVLDDFVECYSERLKRRDLKEIQKIRENSRFLERSYLFERIVPFTLPFLSRKNF